MSACIAFLYRLNSLPCPFPFRCKQRNGLPDTFRVPRGYGDRKRDQRRNADEIAKAVRSWDLAQAARSPGCAAATVPPAPAPATGPEVVIDPDAEPAAAATATTEATATTDATTTARAHKPDTK